VFLRRRWREVDSDSGAEEGAVVERCMGTGGAGNARLVLPAFAMERMGGF